MKKEPILVIMAAGMGSRYGGIKQIDPIGANGEIIIDYSLYDARRAGFKKVVFIIREEIKDDFMEVIGNRAEKYFDCAYALQDLNDIPEGFTVPEGRSKPWGTGHAIYAARHLIDAPFAVINADDFYGREAFQLIYDKLAQPRRYHRRAPLRNGRLYPEKYPDRQRLWFPAGNAPSMSRAI